MKINLNVNLKLFCGSTSFLAGYMYISSYTVWTGRMVEQFYGERFTRGSDSARALSSKAVARFEFQDLSEHQNENPAMENELNV